jgi:hypothetical protein
VPVDLMDVLRGGVAARSCSTVAPGKRHASAMGTVRQVIELAAQLSDEER